MPWNQFNVWVVSNRLTDDILTHNKRILAGKILFIIWNDDLEAIKNNFYGQWKDNWQLYIITKGLITAFYSFLLRLI